MDLKHNIRNVSVIAHVDHGKSTLTDSLVAAASIDAQEVAGDVGMTDTRADEAEHSITTKSTGISLCYKMTDESLKSFKGERMGNKFLLHMIDLPGQVNFSSEVTASLQITDGALVVVDCIDGVRVHTETILRQALGERIRPVLTLSKIDRCFLELQVDGEEAYQTFQRVIVNANVIIATYEDPLLGDVQVYPEKGTVAFSSGLYGWAFTLTIFAKMYSSKFRIDESKMLERLWGENYFDPSTKKWTSMNTGSPTCKRGFVQFCFEPIKQIINTCMNNQKEKLWPVLQKVGVTMKEEDKELLGKALMERVMQTWLPATSLLEMMIFHLPSPSTAQRYRVENLYEGPLDDQFADAIRNCNPEGPLMLYVSKMIPASDKGEFFAFGRVFAGKVSTGMKVRIMGPNYVHGQKNDLYITSVQRIFIWMGKRQESVEDVPCSNTVVMVGLDQFITKNATLTNENDEDAFTIRSIKFSELPVVRVALKCKIASDHPKLIEGLKHLSELVPPLVVYYVGESGEHIVAGPGERHLEIWLRKLIDDFMGGIEVIQSPPMAVFCETVVGRSCPPAMSYTPNKHNGLHVEACPLAKDLVEAIEAGLIGPWDDPKVRSQMLSREFGWDRDAAKKFWCFGPANTGPNLVVEVALDSQQGVKESVITAFLEASHEGGLCGEQMRGICFEVQYGKVDPQTIKRRTCEVSPTASKTIYAAQLNAQPRLVEPIYLLHFLVPNAVIGVTFDILKRRNGHVIKKTYDRYTKLHKLGVLLAVKDSFGMEKTIGTATSGSVVLEYCAFDHWELICSDPLEFGSHMHQIWSWKFGSGKAYDQPKPTLSGLILSPSYSLSL